MHSQICMAESSAADGLLLRWMGCETILLSSMATTNHCGTCGSMLAMSYEKFIADKDLCGALKKPMEPAELTDDAFAIDLIKERGTSGNCLRLVSCL